MYSTLDEGRIQIRNPVFFFIIIQFGLIFEAAMSIAPRKLIPGNSLKMADIVETVVKLGLLNDDQPSLVRLWPMVLQYRVARNSANK